MTEPGKTILTSFPLSATSELIADRISAEAYRRSVQYVALLLIPGLIGLLVGLVVALFEPPIFEAGAIVEMVLHAAPASSRDRIGKAGLAREAQLLVSPQFLNDAFSTLSPELRARLSKRILPGFHIGQGQRALSKFRVAPVPTTSLLRLSYKSSDPQLAIAVVNGLIAPAQLAAPKLKNRQILVTTGFLDERLKMLGARIVAEDKALDDSGKGSGNAQQAFKVTPGRLSAATMRRLRRRKKSRGYGGGAPPTKLELEDEDVDPVLLLLNRETNRADETQRNALARLKLLESLSAAGNHDALEGMARGETGADDSFGIGNLRLRIAKAQSDYAALSQELGPAQPQLRQANAQLEALKGELDNFDRVYLESAKKQNELAIKDRTEIKRALHDQQTTDGKLIEQEGENVILELELGIDLSIYQNLHDLLKVRSTYAGMEAPTLDVVDLATEPLTQEPRPYGADAVLYGAGFMLLGGLAALILNLRRQHLWTVEQAEKAAFMPLMAALPEQSAARGTLAESADVATKDSLYCDAIRELRDGVVSLRSFSAVCLVLIAEVAPQAANSEVAIDLAVDLAGSGAKVLLVDADLVRPCVGEWFGIDTTPGLSEVLSGQLALDAAIIAAPGVAGLSVLPAGTRPPVASTLMQSEEMNLLLQAGRSRFDYVLVNGPPVLASADSSFMADRVDLLLLVARFAKLHLKLIELAGKAVYGPEMPLAGLVIEGAPAMPVDQD